MQKRGGLDFPCSMVKVLICKNNNKFILHNVIKNLELIGDVQAYNKLFDTYIVDPILLQLDACISSMTTYTTAQQVWLCTSFALL